MKSLSVLCAVAVAGFTGVVCAKETVLESPAMRIRFADAANGFAISRVENRLAGNCGFVRAPGNGEGFWSVTFARQEAGTNVYARLSSADVAEKSVVRTPDGGARFLWKNMSLPGEEGVADVAAVVSFDAEGKSEWRLAVCNRSTRWALWRTIYPLLFNVMPEEKGNILMPAKSLGARVIRNYSSRMKTKKRFLHPGCYPSVSAYMVGDAGLYFAAHDDARIKETVFTVGMNAFFETPVENAGVVGKAAEGPRYPVVLACFKGDWWEAAKIYRGWALKRPCMKGRIVDRADFPRAMAETDVWALGGGKPAHAKQVLAKIDASFPDVKKGLEWTQWQEPVFLAQLPDIFPAVPGVSELMAQYEAKCFTFLPYLNGRVWDSANPGWSAAKDKVTVDEAGRPHTEKYNDRDYGVMCPGTTFWQQKVTEMGLKNLNETGANGIYYDQIACSAAFPCYNPNHGHPVGGGTWWTDGYRKALTPVHEAYAVKNAPITSEQAGDFLPDVIDGYLLATVPLADDVPFFTAVYSGYLTYHGIRMMPGNTDEAFFAAHARQLIWGVTPGWVFSWLMEYPRLESKAKIVTRIVNLRHAAKEYLAYGSLLGDLKPLNDLPTEAFDFNDYSSESVNARPISTTRAELPTVIGTVWKSADGKGRAVVAANLSASERTVRFMVPDGVEAFAPRSVKGEPTPYFSTDGGVCTLTLAPHALAFFDGRPGADPVGCRRTHTAGWENVDGLRKEFAPVKVVWQAPDDGYTVTKEDGAEGSVEITNGVVTVRKTNDRGRIVVAARPFAAKGGRVLRFYADVIASHSPVATGAGGRLCAWTGERRLDPIDRWGLKWFAAGGDAMRQVVNMVSPMAYRKYFHLPIEKDGRATVAIVVDGVPSESSWCGLAAEDNDAAQDWWEKYRATMSHFDRTGDMCPEDAFRKALAADTDHTAEIEIRNGFSTLLIDGKPVPPIAYKSSGECGSDSRGVIFAGKPVQDYGGVPLAVMSLRLGDLGLKGCEGPWRKSGFDARELADAVEKNMRVGDRMLYVLALNTSAYPEFTIEEHPDEVWIKEDGSVARGNSGSVIPDQYNDGGKLDEGDKRWPWVSYASPAWRTAVKRIVGETFDELRRRGLMKRIIGVHFCGYHDGQFAMPILDYSKCAKDAYADYLKRNNLKETDPEGTFSYFSSQLGFFALEDFSREAKRLAGKPIIACRWVMSPFNVAFDMGSFVKSEAVDVIINQPDYSKRLPGLPQGIRVPAESFHLHRKLQWCEFDLRTYAALDFWAHSVLAVKGLNTASDLAMWRNIHRKHAGLMNAHRMGWWYYDMADGWYYPREIATDVGEVYAQSRELAAKAPDPWRPDVALVIDEVAMSAYGKPGGPNVPSRATLCNLQWTKSAASGVPFDSYLALDFYAKPELAKRYKAVIWSGFNAPDAKQKALMDRVAAWGIPSFVVQPGGFTPEFLNGFAKDAGAYVMCEPGKLQVDVNGDFLSVHCLVPGKYEIRLPFDAKVVNLKDGSVATGERLWVDLSAGETCWFRLSHRSGPVLENADMRISFADEAEGFGIRRIANRLAGGAEFVAADGSRDDFWTIRFKRRRAGVTVWHELSNRSPAATRRMTKTANGARFFFGGLDLPDETGVVDVTADIVFTPDGGSEWRLSVENRSTIWALHTTLYPRLNDIVPEGGADVMLPGKTIGGSLFRNYVSSVKLPRVDLPSPSCYPMASAFWHGDAGLYLGVHDEAYRRKFFMIPNGVNGMNTWFETPVEDAGVVGRAAEGPRYAVTLKCFAGDWWKAAAIYRKWALSRKCIKGRIVDRGDYPESMAETDIWALGGDKTNWCYKVLRKLDDQWQGLRKGIEWTQWQRPPYLWQLPDIFPADEGIPEAMAVFRKSGFTILPYLNGRIWDTNNASYASARAAVCRYPNGSDYREPYNGHRFGVMCPATDLWQRKLQEIGERNLSETGANGIYYDQVTCSPAPPCANPVHGHSLEGGAWWVEGYRKALTPVHRRYAACNAPITSEQGGDFLPDVVDGYLLALMPRGEDVPFWPVVYSGYLIYHGPRVMPNNDGSTFFAMYARYAIWGVTPGWAFDWMLAGTGFPSKIPVVTQLGRFRHAAKKFLAYGSLTGDLKPLGEIDRVTFVFKDFSGPLAKSPCDSSKAELNALIGAWWRSADGKRRALAVANVSEEDQTADFAVPKDLKRLSPVPITGWEPPAAAISDGSLRLALKAQTMAFLVEENVK